MTHDIAKIDNYSVYRRLGNNIGYHTVSSLSGETIFTTKEIEGNFIN